MDIFLGIDLMKGQWAEGVNPPQVLDRIPASDSSRKNEDNEMDAKTRDIHSPGYSFEREEGTTYSLNALCQS